MVRCWWHATVQNRLVELCLCVLEAGSCGIRLRALIWRQCDVRCVHTQVSRSRAAVMQGTTELVQAKRYFKKSRRLMCCLLVLVLIICAVIAIAVVLSLHPWSRH